MKKFPNGFSCWQESHFDIVSAIAIELNKDEPQGIVGQQMKMQGKGGIYELAEDLTDEFENRYKDIVWGEELDYHDTMEEFIHEKLG